MTRRRPRCGLAGRDPRPVVPRRGTRVAVQIPDGPGVHLLYLAAERAGMVVVGIETAARRSREVDTPREGRTAPSPSSPNFHRVRPGPVHRSDPAARLHRPTSSGSSNSTSGTTGLPKCVMHHQRRWFAFHRLAADAGAARRRRRVRRARCPAPFGFGLWTAHFSPTILGAPCVVSEPLLAEAVLAAIERHRVTVLAAVSTQFVMMLELARARRPRPVVAARPVHRRRDGAARPRREFEDRTGARSCSSTARTRPARCRAPTHRRRRDIGCTPAGRVIPEMHVRLFDPDTGADITATGGPGVPACHGPAICLGYYDDASANAELFTADGWMRIGDLVHDRRRRLPHGRRRTSDFIIRGGKNISAPPRSRTRSARIPRSRCAPRSRCPTRSSASGCACFVVAHAGSDAPTLPRICDAPRGTRHRQGALWPEHLVVMDDDLPPSGREVAEAELRPAALGQIPTQEVGIDRTSPHH